MSSERGLNRMDVPPPNLSPPAAVANSGLRLEDLRVRILVLAGGLALLGLLATTRWLSPDSRGLGTHEQLGLPPCGFYLLYGFPCPSCGMTTSWSWLTRGNFTEAVRQHFGGALFGVYCFLLGVWLVISALLGRWLGGLPSSLTWAVTFGILTLAIVVTWIVKLWA